MLFFSNQNKINSKKKNINKARIKGGISLITIFFFFNIFFIQSSQAGRGDKGSEEFKIFSTRLKTEWNVFYPNGKDWTISEDSVLRLFDRLYDSREILTKTAPVSLQLERAPSADVQPLVIVPEGYRKAQVRKLLDGRVYLDFGTRLGRGGVKSWHEFVHVESGQHFAATVMEKNKRFETLVKVLKIANEDPQSKLMRMQLFHEGAEVQLLSDVFDTDLGHYLAEHTPDVPFKKRIIEDLCRAVTALHRHQILHGDLKPDNILLKKWDTDKTQHTPPDPSSQDMYPVLALSDFDFVYSFHEVEQTGVMNGSFPFAPPEAYRRTLEVDPILVARRDMFGVGMLALTLFYPDLWKNSESAKELRELWTAVPHFKTLIVQQEGLRKGKQSELKSIREEIASMDERQKIRGLPTSEMLEADLAADDEQLKPEDERSGLQALLHRQRVNVRYTKQMEDKIKSLRESIHETFIEIADHFQLFQADVDRFSVPDEDREVKNRQLFELIRNAVRINVRERSDLEPFCSQFPSAFIQGS